MTNDEEKVLARKVLAERAANEYTTGLTVMQVSEQLACSYGKAYALIKEGGAEIRPRGARFAPPADT